MTLIPHHWKKHKIIQLMSCLNEKHYKTGTYKMGYVLALMTILSIANILFNVYTFKILGVSNSSHYQHCHIQSV